MVRHLFNMHERNYTQHNAHMSDPLRQITVNSLSMPCMPITVSFGPDSGTVCTVSNGCSVQVTYFRLSWCPANCQYCAHFFFFSCGKLRCGHSMTWNVNKREICRMRDSPAAFSTSTTYLRIIFVAKNVRG